MLSKEASSPQATAVFTTQSYVGLLSVERQNRDCLCFQPRYDSSLLRSNSPALLGRLRGTSHHLPVKEK